LTPESSDLGVIDVYTPNGVRTQVIDKYDKNKSAHSLLGPVKVNIRELHMKRLAFVIAVGLAGVSAAQAAPLYDNLSNSSGFSDPIDTAVFGPLANSFSTLGMSYAFSDIRLLLQKSGESPGTFVTVNLLSDSGTTAPGSLLSLLGTIDDSNITSSPGVISLSFAPVLLAANTRYWIELTTSPGAGGAWLYALDDSGTGVAGEFFSNQQGMVFPNTQGPYVMAINGTNAGTVAAPEPMTLSLFGAGMIAGVALYRRRRTV
jgi:hypothetical protein